MGLGKDMRQSSVAFHSKNLTLQGVVASPTEVSSAAPGIVVCHSHPVFGGDMNNGLVLEMCRTLVERGFVTLRFDFRGVGDSEGEFTKGEKEVEDVASALDVLRHWPGVKRNCLGVAGYSFGASMILSGMARYKSARAFALVSPPLGALKHLKSRRDKRPMLFVTGEKDLIVPYPAFKSSVATLDGHIELEAVPGADHSWRGFEADGARVVARFFAGSLGG